jgi:hypothetical protein
MGFVAGRFGIIDRSLRGSFIGIGVDSHGAIYQWISGRGRRCGNGIAGSPGMGPGMRS